MADDFGKWLASKSREFGVEPVPSRTRPSNFLELVAKNPHGYGGFLPAEPTSDQPASDEPTYRMAMLPFGTYAGPDGKEHLGFAVPGMIQEPINALHRLAQNSVDENGNIAIPNPENPQNREDVLTGLLSMYGGNALNPLTRLPENAVGMFAGRMAKTADHAALARAEDLASKGAPRDQIWNETGWFQGSDGKWRFEINDEDSAWQSLHPSEVQPGQSIKTTYGNAVYHPELGEAYPDLVERPMQYVKVARPAPGTPYGTYSPSSDAFAVRATEFSDPRSTALHEGQHAIQQREGFASGSNPKLESANLTTPQDPIVNKMRQDFVHRVFNEPGYGGSSQAIADWDRILKLERQLNEDTARERYRASAGEVEARNVQTRADMSPEERKARPPWLTQDIPDNEQIIRFLSDTGKPSLMGSAIASASNDTDPSFKDDLLQMMDEYGIAPPASQAPSQPTNYLAIH